MKQSNFDANFISRTEKTPVSSQKCSKVCGQDICTVISTENKVFAFKLHRNMKKTASTRSRDRDGQALHTKLTHY